jgi:hypothetical protein
MSPAFAGLGCFGLYPQLALWATVCRQLRWLGIRFADAGAGRSKLRPREFLHFREG